MELLVRRKCAVNLGKYRIKRLNICRTLHWIFKSSFVAVAKSETHKILTSAALLRIASPSDAASATGVFCPTHISHQTARIPREISSVYAADPDRAFSCKREL